MPTLKEKKQLLNKRIAEIDGVYEDNANKADKAWNEAEQEALRILQRRDVFGKYKEQRLLLLNRLNEAEMSRFVNREFSFLISLIRDLGIVILELRDDLEKTSSSVNMTIPKIDKHDKFLEEFEKFLEGKKKQDEDNQQRKQEEQKKIKDLSGGMYG
jgi:hypothetical protein